MKNQTTMKSEPNSDMITQRAREIWKAAGCPEGRDLEYWLQAEAELLAARHSDRTPQVGVSQASPKREATRPLASSAPGPEAKKPQNCNAHAPLGAVARQARRR